MFQKPPIEEDPLDALMNRRQTNFWAAVYAVGPAILLHELGHKFVAMYFGLEATFHAAYTFLALGVGLKLLNFPFIFFVPAYVTHPFTSAGQSAVISVMGPLVNLVLALGCWVAIKYHVVPHKYKMIAQIAVTVNFFLFIMNMLPIPGFDGFSFYVSIWQMF